jgi:hypothetical protein
VGRGTLGGNGGVASNYHALAAVVARGGRGTTVNYTTATSLCYL